MGTHCAHRGLERPSRPPGAAPNTTAPEQRPAHEHDPSGEGALGASDKIQEGRTGTASTPGG